MTYQPLVRHMRLLWTGILLLNCIEPAVRSATGQEAKRDKMLHREDGKTIVFKSLDSTAEPQSRLQQFSELEKRFPSPSDDPNVATTDEEMSKKKLAELRKQSQDRTKKLKEISDAAEKYAQTVSTHAAEKNRGSIYTGLYKQLCEAGFRSPDLKLDAKEQPRGAVLFAGSERREPIYVFPTRDMDRDGFTWQALPKTQNVRNIGDLLGWDPTTWADGRLENTVAVLTDSNSITSLPHYQVNLRGLVQDPNERYLDYRITSGEPDGDDVFPSVVAIGYQLGRVSEWKATGVVVAPNVVVTAGHCYNSCNERVGGRIFIGLSVDLYGETVKVLKATRHPDYLKKDANNAVEEVNDLTVLILEKDISAPYYPLAPVNSLTTAPRPRYVRVVGYGATDDRGGGFGVRRMAGIPIACYCDDPVCKCSDFGCDSRCEFIAGRRGGPGGAGSENIPLADTCSGDSGGGVFLYDNKKGWMLLGITSRGTPENRSSTHLCGDGGIYVRLDLSNYRDWIMGVPGGHW